MAEDSFVCNSPTVHQIHAFLAIFMDIIRISMKKLNSYRACTAGLLAFLPFTMFAGPRTGETAKNLMSQGPQLFIENKGQILDQNQKPRSDIDFSFGAGDMDVFVGDGAIHYQWSKSTSASIGKAENDIQVQGYRMDVVLVGANLNAPLIKEGAQAYHENYYLSQCHGVTANSFQKITYRNVYPNIDWVLYTTSSANGSGGLKYDFIVHPGGDPSDIKLRYEGASSLSIALGALTASTPMGTVTEKKPYSYDAETKAEIPSRFVLNGDVLSFDVEAGSGTTVIDPELVWKTYMGGNGGDLITAIAADAGGNGYIGGYTLSTSLATFGTHQFSFKGVVDGFILKFDTTGSITWATFYGGSLYDQVSAVAADKNGNVYATGHTNSTSDITYSSPIHQSAYVGMYDAFLLKLNSNGGMSWATYYGNANDDLGTAVACDPSGNVFMAGTTQSPNTNNNIASSGAYRTTPSGAFLAKFSPSGGRMWATYVADTGYHTLNGIACDLKGNVYCVGATPSYQNIASAGSHQPANGGGIIGPLHLQDGFLVKYSDIGVRQWGTYYGGTDLDEIVGVDCDERGDVYIAGITKSTNGTSIATAGTHQSSYPASSATSGFAARFDESGNRKWGTYYSTNLEDWVQDVKAMPGGRMFVSGFRSYTGSNPPPSFSFVGRFNGKGHLTWERTRLTDGTVSKLAYTDGMLYFGSRMASADSATLPTNLSGGADAFVVRYFVDTVAFINQPFADTTLCVGDTLKVPFDVTNKFNSTNMVKLQMSDASGSFTNATDLTSMTADSAGVFKYVIPNTMTSGVGYKLRLVSSSPVDTSLDNVYALRISEYPKVAPAAIGAVCANGVLQLRDTGSSPSTTSFLYTGPGGYFIANNSDDRHNIQITDTGWYILKGDNYGCIDIDSVHITVIPKPDKPVFSNNSPVCESDTLKLSVSSTTPTVSTYTWAHYQGSSMTPVWYGPDRGDDTTIVSASLGDTGRYVVIAIDGGCPSDPETTTVVVNRKVIPTVQINAAPGNVLGPWQSITFNISGSSNTGTAPTYQWTKNGSSIPNATGTSYSGTTGIDLQTGDTICVIMTSNAQCVKPATVKNCVGIQVDLGVDDINTIKGLQLYPNPNNGKFVLKATEPFVGEEISVSNALGQEVYRGTPKTGITAYEIDLGSIPSGMYILRASLNGRNAGLRFTVTE